MSSKSRQISQIPPSSSPHGLSQTQSTQAGWSSVHPSSALTSRSSTFGRFAPSPGTIYPVYKSTPIRSAEGLTEDYQTIVMMAEYSHKSPEELRVEDYFIGRKPPMANPKLSFKPFAWTSTPGHPAAFPAPSTSHSRTFSAIRASASRRLERPLSVPTPVKTTSATKANTAEDATSASHLLAISRKPYRPATVIPKSIPASTGIQLCTCGACEVLAWKAFPKPLTPSRNGTQAPAFTTTRQWIGENDLPVPATSDVRFCTITCMPEYAGKSVEELRLEDYAENRKSGDRPGVEHQSAPLTFVWDLSPGARPDVTPSTVKTASDAKSASLHSPPSPAVNTLQASDNPRDVEGSSVSPLYRRTTLEGELSFERSGSTNPSIRPAHEAATDPAEVPVSPDLVPRDDDEISLLSHVTSSSPLASLARSLAESSPSESPLPLSTSTSTSTSILDDYTSHKLCDRRLDAEVELRMAEEVLRRASQARCASVEEELQEKARALDAKSSTIQELEEQLAEAQLARRTAEESRVKSEEERDDLRERLRRLQEIILSAPLTRVDDATK
ncbi:hypothetical protein EXIGLDRAFT_837996 [Exidia glandulosa HHB12029]|uniref:Uncharacterized protein n=1 Tax=Exidia glandulosa HHB12029 TaxID=1314781 RepID=A0A165G8I7_EXIGL|nr:hypothetical protein EXIGLDRAFT_837996 [Exidia glandulosa HHB12029]